MLGLAELAPPPALLRWSFGLLARPQFSQRRRFLLLISTEPLGRRRRAIFRAASTKPERRMLSVLLFNLTRRVGCSIPRRRSCKAFLGLLCRSSFMSLRPARPQPAQVASSLLPPASRQ